MFKLIFQLQVVAATNSSVDEVNYYITEQYTTGLFNSCKNVQLSFTTSPAIGISCGAHSTDCTPHLWLQYMGGHDPSPYQINFYFETSDNVTSSNGTFYPMNETIIPCSESVRLGGAACSCVDCPCSPEPPPDPPAEQELFNLPLVAAIMLLIYIVLTFVIISGFLYISLRPKREGKFVNFNNNCLKPSS